MRRKIFAVIILLLLSVTSIPIATSSSNGTQKLPKVLPDYAIVMLKDQPLASYNGGVPGYAGTAPGPGHKLNANSSASNAYKSYLGLQHGAAISYLKRNMPQIQVVAQYSIVFNGLAVKLNGNAMNGLLNAPGISSVFYDGLNNLTMDVSPALIGAPALWTAVGGQSNAGAGIKIGIIDTGIDQTHPFLTDNTLTPPAGFPKCDAIDSSAGVPNVDCKYVSDKVIVAKVFETLTSFDGRAAQAHGTHVSGIAAGVAGTCAPYVGCGMSGIAPKAFLGSYNVFPGNVLDASDHDIMKAVEAAVADGMDVLNLSLGGTARPTDALVNAVDHAVDAGVIVVVAAGNSGPLPGTVESPGIASKVITVGASTNPHYIGEPLTVGTLGVVGAAVGSFSNAWTSGSLTYTTTTPVNGCAAITNTITGDVALIKRGVCTFSTKIRNAQTAGAIGVIMYNSQLGDPISMGQDGTPSQPTIPAVMVSNSNGIAMAALAPNTVSVSTTLQEFLTSSSDIIASFSSRGPPTIQNPGSPSSSGVLDKIKPDVMAPGVNVYSSVPSYYPGAFCVDTSTPSDCYAVFQGTSMATPHVTGAAALLKQQHLDWTPDQVKSALITTGDPVTNYLSPGAVLKNPMTVGGGRIDLAHASGVTATADNPSLDFGYLVSSAISRQISFTLTSVAGGTVAYSLSVVPAVPGPAISLSTSSVTLTPGASSTVVVSLVLSPTLSGQYYGNIVITGGSVTLRIPYWVQVG